MAEIYFDNAATTKPYKEVCELVKKTMEEDYGNPSSMHKRGFGAEQIINNATDIIAGTLRCKRENIIYTSGATESNNTCLISIALGKMAVGKHIITTSIEHPSVSEALMYLKEKFGFEITTLAVDERGYISLDELKSALREDTILVSVIYVNNEIGVIQDIANVSKAVKSYNENIVLHCDVVQAYGKIELRPKKYNIDLMSVSGHKFHGPKGVGFIYKSEKLHLPPFIHGGGQQNKLRSGTQNVAGIAGMGLAAKMSCSKIEENKEHILGLKESFVRKLLEIGDVVINSHEGCVPNIVSATVQGVRAEVLLHAIEESGIYVSAGSACSTNRAGHSPTLMAMGLSEQTITSTLRFSFCGSNTMEEVDRCIEVMSEQIPLLRKFMRR